ncbi:hypothetical protein SBOR_6215 [Sclerotinia borealis F-4128]|uniref:BTB domain-containing protein n=1 Tax=Sclerotinia borealis (strain F-4128) TaxID=1432307 RepID=W9CFU9_SCLBF|nr:hypothetical protein SBOR_6215 [Sclerotinia borealis F-4128]
MSHSKSSDSRDNSPIDTTKALWARMMSANEYSDFIIKCHSRIFHVHRIVVCTQSKPIQAAANGNFLESVTGILELEDDDPSTVARMINFFYLQDYDDSSTSEEAAKEDYGPLLINTMVYIIGDKYDIPGLQTLAKQKYEKAILTDWNTTSFSASLELLYEELPESNTCLTSLALHTASTHVKELKGRAEFTQLCKSNAAIAYDLFTSIASQSQSAISQPTISQSKMLNQEKEKEKEASTCCPKGHTFTHLKDVRAMYDTHAGKWRVRCPNCKAQKVCYKVGNECDVGAKWDGGEVGFWFL